jgi:hypothetical protein
MGDYLEKILKKKVVTAEFLCGNFDGGTEEIHGNTSLIMPGVLLLFLEHKRNYSFWS